MTILKNLLGGLIGGFFSGRKLKKLEKRATKAEITATEAKAKVNLMEKKEEARVKLKDGLEKIKHPKKGFKEWKEQDRRSG